MGVLLLLRGKGERGVGGGEDWEEGKTDWEEGKTGRRQGLGLGCKVNKKIN
jgi:hypothetical protein